MRRERFWRSWRRRRRPASRRRRPSAKRNTCGPSRSSTAKGASRSATSVTRRRCARFPRTTRTTRTPRLSQLSRSSGPRTGGRDIPTYMRAAAILEEVVCRHPNHPGAAHYLIHSYDDPAHASLGLRAARRYSKIAPDAAHAQHMTSHIFIALGMWDDVVAANETAVAVTNRSREKRGLPPVSCGHYASWLQYGYLEQGRVAEAKRLLEGCRGQAGSAPGHEGHGGSPRSRRLGPRVLRSDVDSVPDRDRRVEGRGRPLGRLAGSGSGAARHVRVDERLRRRPATGPRLGACGARPPSRRPGASSAPTCASAKSRTSPGRRGLRSSKESSAR